MLMMPLLGLSGNSFSVKLTGRTVLCSVFDPTDAEVGFRLGTDGKIYSRTSFGGAYSQLDDTQWLTPHDALVADLYECFATLNSGTLTTGTSGSWLALTSDRDWTLTQTVVGDNECNITVAVRLIGSTTTLTSAAVQLSAIVEP